jgi:RAVE protein 1 C terminal
LAIAVARVYEGDHGPVLTDFLSTRVLPQAVNSGNRWLATWALWMLGKRDRAVRALVLPLSVVISPPETPRLDARLFSADDPALIVLYKQLREKSLQTLRGAISISPRVEWDFVMHTARLYCRMGCDLLALDLGKFLATPEHSNRVQYETGNSSPSRHRYRATQLLPLMFSIPALRRSFQPLMLIQTRADC